MKKEMIMLFIYDILAVGTFIYLTFLNDYVYNYWNWIIAIPINIFLSSIWPIYWLILNWLPLTSTTVSNQDNFELNRNNAEYFVNRIQKELPLKIDKNTLLYKVSISNEILFLDYKLNNWNYSEISEDTIKRAKKPLQDFIKPTFCDNSLFLGYMKNDSDLMVSYSTNDEVKLFEFSLNIKDCTLK